MQLEGATVQLPLVSTIPEAQTVQLVSEVQSLQAVGQATQDPLCGAVPAGQAVMQ